MFAAINYARLCRNRNKKLSSCVTSHVNKENLDLPFVCKCNTSRSFTQRKTISEVSRDLHNFNFRLCTGNCSRHGENVSELLTTLRLVHHIHLTKGHYDHSFPQLWSLPFWRLSFLQNKHLRTAFVECCTESNLIRCYPRRKRTSESGGKCITAKRRIR